MTKKRRALDLTVPVGLLIAFACVIGGLMLEKGDLKDVTQTTAAVIVFGGTIGALVVSTPKATLISAVKRVRSVLKGDPNPGEIIETLVALSIIMRRSGPLSLEAHLDDIDNRFLKKALQLVVDGFTPEEIRLMLETDIDGCERLAESDAKVFEAAGGYAPTIGILGAVLGLIQVMKHLDQMQEVGRGIAVAFVATIYGVAAANIFFLPLGAKIRNQARGISKINEMILEGMLAIQEGRNPRVVRELIEPFAFGSRAPKASDERAASAVVFPGSRKAS